MQGRSLINAVYMELVDRVVEMGPVGLHHVIQSQLSQLNSMSLPTLRETAALSLQGDQYECFTRMTRNIVASQHRGQMFLVTGPGGTGKSYLLKAF